MVTNEPICSAAVGDTDVENRLVDTEKRSGWDEWREWCGNIYITICKILASGSFLCDSGSSNPYSVTT